LYRRHGPDKRDAEPGQDLGDRVPVLGSLGAHQGVPVGGGGVDPLGDATTRPGDEAGEQQRTEDEQHDLETAAAQPGADVGEWSDRGTPFTTS
jgi:hypothetical protein